jgi:siroheme synthase
MSVFLVGAGPGDPGLITYRGWKLLVDAEVVIFDRLAPSALLDFVPARATRIDVG